MKKPAIPSTQQVVDPVVANILRPMKENIEIMTGIRGGGIETLADNAPLSDVISKINEIIERINAY
jgi:hypothetical protein